MDEDNAIHECPRSNVHISTPGDALELETLAYDACHRLHRMTLGSNASFSLR